MAGAPEIITCAQAVASGEKWYFTGRPCVRGHLAKRHVAGRCCEGCKLEWQKGNNDKLRSYGLKYFYKNHETRLAAGRLWHHSNPDKVQEKGRRWQKANPEKSCTATKEWQAANKDKVRLMNIAWRNKNREKARAYVRNRSAKIRDAEGSHSPEDVRLILKSQRGKCAYCRVQLGTAFHVDHIMPLSKGGSNFPNNLQVTCSTCNVKKNAKHPSQFARELGRLI